MTDEQLKAGRHFGVDPERVVIRPGAKTFVSLHGITRAEFTVLAPLCNDTYHLSMLKPGERLYLGCSKHEEWFETMFTLYSSGLDLDTVKSILDGYKGDVPAYVWDALAGGSAA